MTDSIVDLVNRRIDGHSRQNINTSIPAVVTNVDNLTEHQIIDATPLVNRVFEDGVVMQPTNIFDIPVVFQTGGGGIISFPIAVGDTVLLVYSMRSIDEWMNSDGTNQTPQDRRHHHRTDAIAIPGIYTKTTNLKPSSTDVEIKFKNMSVVMEPDDTLTVASGQSSITISPDKSINLNDSVSSIILDGSGGVAIDSTTLTHNGKNIGDTHTHGGVQSGGSSTAVPD